MVRGVELLLILSIFIQVNSMGSIFGQNHNSKQKIKFLEYLRGHAEGSTKSVKTKAGKDENEPSFNLEVLPGQKDKAEMLAYLRGMKSPDSVRIYDVNNPKHKASTHHRHTDNNHRHTDNDHRHTDNAHSHTDNAHRHTDNDQLHTDNDHHHGDNDHHHGDNDHHHGDNEHHRGHNDHRHTKNDHHHTNHDISYKLTDPDHELENREHPKASFSKHEEVSSGHGGHGDTCFWHGRRSSSKGFDDDDTKQSVKRGDNQVIDLDEVGSQISTTWDCIQKKFWISYDKISRKICSTFSGR